MKIKIISTIIFAGLILKVSMSAWYDFKLQSKRERCLHEGRCFQDAKSGVFFVKMRAGSIQFTRHSGPSKEEEVSVDLNSFWIAESEVTVAQYQRCVDAKVCTEPARGGQSISSENWCTWGKSSQFDDRPVNCLNWNQARTFSQWVGGDLPTEAQWRYSVGRELKVKDIYHLGTYLEPTDTYEPNLYGLSRLPYMSEWMLDLADLSSSQGYWSPDHQSPLKRVVIGNHNLSESTDEGLDVFSFRPVLESLEVKERRDLCFKEKRCLRDIKSGLTWVQIQGQRHIGQGKPHMDMGRDVDELNPRSLWIAESAVTVAQYRICVESGSCTQPHKQYDRDPRCTWWPSSGYLEHYPITCLSYEQAQEFAQWVGGDIPTQSEWEYASGVSLHQDDQKYYQPQNIRLVKLSSPNKRGLFDMTHYQAEAVCCGFDQSNIHDQQMYRTRIRPVRRSPMDQNKNIVTPN